MKVLRNCGLAVAGIIVVAAAVTVLLVSGEGDAREIPQSAAELEARKAAAETAQSNEIDVDLHDFGAQCSAPEDAEEGRTWSCSVEPQGAGQCFGTVRIVATGTGSARREDDEIECGE
ncbi:MAG: hypothetical protein M3088_06025 [Actinomycetota bacterium]|nr:hypothetical protein [Actinomycetota bacterium]